MHCSKCGQKLEGSEKFCAKCGHKVDTAAAPAVAKAAPKKNNGVLGMFHISDEEFEKQILNHDTLKITRSSRGIAVLTILALLGLGLVIIIAFTAFSSDFPVSLSDVFWTLLVYAPLIYFTYRGQLWAIVGLGVWYSFDKLYTSIILNPSHFNISAIIFWMIGVAPLWVAFKVEREYRRRKIAASQ